MAAPPASTKTSLRQTLSTRARERWPELAGAPEDALDTACGLYLDDPSAWT